MTYWPEDPYGDMVPLLQASIEAAKLRHPSGKGKPVNAAPPVEPTPTLQVMTNVLTAADRCDACPAAAVYRMAKVGSTSALDYCLHHWRKYVPQMGVGWGVIGANPELAAAIGGEGP